MISRNTEDYIKIDRNYISPALVDSIRKELDIKDSLFKKHQYSKRDEQTNQLEFFSEQNDLWVYDDEISVSDEIRKSVWYSIANYIDFLQFPWFMEWYGYTAVRYNKYPVNTRMDLHCDHIHSAFDGQRKGIPVLTILCGLSDPSEYTGGELIFFGDTKVDLNKGDLMIFPSNFLYPHMVTPVESGVRYSFVSWVW